MASPDSDFPEKKADEIDIGIIVLMLSLYLIMLAFFILLNAISEDSPERREMVAESLMENFSFRTIGEHALDDDFEITSEPVFDVVSQEIKGVVETYLSLKEFSFMRQGDQLQVNLPTDRFFERGDVRLNPAMVGFFEDMAKAINTSHKGLRIEATVVVRGEPKDIESGENITPFELAGRRATLFVRALAERGASPEHLSAASLSVKRLGNIQVDFNVIITDEKEVLKEARYLLENLSANEWLN